jgi:hypothetical protein
MERAEQARSAGRFKSSHTYSETERRSLWQPSGRGPEKVYPDRQQQKSESPTYTS